MLSGLHEIQEGQVSTKLWSSTSNVWMLVSIIRIEILQDERQTRLWGAQKKALRQKLASRGRMEWASHPSREWRRLGYLYLDIYVRGEGRRNAQHGHDGGTYATSRLVKPTSTWLLLNIFKAFHMSGYYTSTVHIFFSLMTTLSTASRLVMWEFARFADGHLTIVILPPASRMAVVWVFARFAVGYVILCRTCKHFWIFSTQLCIRD